jgi:hypothetical protein
LLSAPRRPDFAVDSIQQLGWLADNILICAGPKEDLLCLERGTGKDRWRVPRVWEFARGFTGPSVWAHHIGRFGADGFGGDDKPPAAKELEERFESAIVGGPVVVSLPEKDRDQKQTSVFVAVSRAPKSPWSGYLSDCIVYEFSESGAPIGMATLPRMINGWQWGKIEGGVVWGCQRGGLIRLGVSENRSSFGGHLGRDDMLCRVDWYRQASARLPDAWLRTGPAGEPLAFSATHAFRVSTGGYVSKQEENVFRFPITMVDLSTSVERTLLLAVPFKGKAPKPESNFSGSNAGITTHGPYLLGVTGLEVEGQVLRIVLGMEGSATGVEFAIHPLLAESTKRP